MGVPERESEEHTHREKEREVEGGVEEERIGNGEERSKTGQTAQPQKKSQPRVILVDFNLEENREMEGF